MKKNMSILGNDFAAGNNNEVMQSFTSQSLSLLRPTKTPHIRISKKALYDKITNIFIIIGIPAHFNGYHFLREAIQLAVGNFDMLSCITKNLYPTVACRFNTTASIVERSIRNAIEIAYNKGKMVNLNTIFGIAVFEHNYKPSNSELIALLAEKLYLDCK